MTEERIEGSSNKLVGRLQEGLGSLTGDGKLQLDGALKQARGAAVDGYGRAVDALDSKVQSLPANIQPQARQVMTFAREKPLATVGILAAVGFLLTRRR